MSNTWSLTLNRFPSGEENHVPLRFRARSLVHTLSVPLQLHQWDGQCRSSHLHALPGTHQKCTFSVSENKDGFYEQQKEVEWCDLTYPVQHIILQQEDSLDQSLSTMSVSMSGTNVYEAARLSGGSSIMENLQSQLKLREGEIAQLQVAFWKTFSTYLRRKFPLMPAVPVYSNNIPQCVMSVM